MLQAPGRKVVRNASSAKERAFYERLDERRQDRLREAMAAVMETEAGRIVMWELLSTCGIYRSVWENSSRIHYNAGRQDLGHELLADLHVVSTDKFQVMEREARAYARREESEIEAHHTKRASEHEGSDHDGH